VVGIVGANGAGKTTLLKVLSRVTRPSTGEAELYGRVGSLLEVGTGFHPELTGRENIFLSAALLGMKAVEVRRKFDEIVAFSETEEFLATPVKHYSNGMYLRLAFAIAAHLETEILFVDEVLAVGDAAFQRKCLGRIDAVAREGRTVLLVSHNLPTILSLCHRALRLDRGVLVDDGPPPRVVASYLESQTSRAVSSLEHRVDRGGDGSARVTSLKVETDAPGSTIRCGSALRITIEYRSPGPLRHPRFQVGVYDASNVGLYLLDSDSSGIPDLLPPHGYVACLTDPINLTPGRCFLNVALYRGPVMADHVPLAARFDVEADDFHGSGRLPPREWVLGLLHHRWSAAPDEPA
jgi:lipopolysaccharide transport system ATP-binding protein